MYIYMYTHKCVHAYLRAFTPATSRYGLLLTCNGNDEVQTPETRVRTYVYVCMYICIYVYIDRQIKRKRARETER